MNTCELLCHLHPDFPHVLCLTEYHLKYPQLNNVHIENYNLAAYYCRQLCEKGGVAIFVHNSLCFSNIGIVKHCEEQDIGICVLELSFGVLNICVLTLYRAPSGNFSCLLVKLDNILKLLYTPTLNIIMFGDININRLMESEKKNQLDNLLLSYNLNSIIIFPTRVQNTSAAAIDNIFIDIYQFESYTGTPFLNVLFDHDSQLLMICADYSHMPIQKSKSVRRINKCTIYESTFYCALVLLMHSANMKKARYLILFKN